MKNTAGNEVPGMTLCCSKQTTSGYCPVHSVGRPLPAPAPSRHPEEMDCDCSCDICAIGTGKHCGKPPCDIGASATATAPPSEWKWEAKETRCGNCGNRKRNHHSYNGRCPVFTPGDNIVSGWSETYYAEPVPPATPAAPPRGEYMQRLWTTASILCEERKHEGYRPCPFCRMQAGIDWLDRPADSPVGAPRCPSCGSYEKELRMCMIANCGESHDEETEFNRMHLKAVCCDSWHSTKSEPVGAPPAGTPGAGTQPELQEALLCLSELVLNAHRYMEPETRTIADEQFKRAMDRAGAFIVRHSGETKYQICKTCGTSWLTSTGEILPCPRCVLASPSASPTFEEMFGKREIYHEDMILRGGAIWDSRRQVWNAAHAPSAPAPVPPTPQLVIDLCRELYDRFVMGGWGPQDAHEQVRQMLAGAAERPPKGGTEQ